MAQESTSSLESLQDLSEILLEIHTQILDVKRRSDPGLRGVPGMNRLIRDPEWAWLRSLSSLIADVDHRAASKEPLTEADVAAFAARARGTLLGQGYRSDPDFLEQYRPLFQDNAALASAHGDLKHLLDRLP
jgi:hypothetical protein